MSKFILPPISEEQSKILSLIKEQNLIIDSVAGSGKTTTNLYLAKTFPDHKILILTYNSKLRLETKQKAEDLAFSNIEIHTFHSFCVRFFKSPCHNDTYMRKILDKGLSFCSAVDFDIVIIDESQDLIPLYSRLIKLILFEMKNSKKPRICFLGDENQCIYQFNGADERYLLYADQIFNPIDNNGEDKIEWGKAKLSQSFRVTKPIADFINKCMLKKNRIAAVKQGLAVIYVICDSFCNQKDGNIPNSPLFHLLDCLKKGYKYEDIFILCPSTKNPKAPIKYFANILTELHIPIYVPNLEDEKLNAKILENKVVFSTFHQAKGLERKVVIVYGFDSSYFTFFKKNYNPLICPNELYVAATRASELLILIHHENNDYLQFLDKSMIDKFSIKIGQMNNYIFPIKNRQMQTSVTELVRHLPCEIIEKALTYIDIEETQKEEDFIDVPVHVRQREIYYEDVSDINGTAIPAWFELQASPNNTQSQVRDNIINRTKMFLKRNNTDNNQIEIPELLERSNIWNSTKSGYKFKVKQITNYNWLSPQNLEKCLNRLKKHISKAADFEVKINMIGEEELLFRELTGYIDSWDELNVWEFKCVSNLTDEHKLQLAIYMYLFEMKLHIRKKRISKEKNKGLHKRKGKYGKWIYEANLKMNYFLINILNNNIFKIKSSLSRLKEMIKALFEYKYQERKIESTEDFINRNLSINAIK